MEREPDQAGLAGVGWSVLGMWEGVNSPISWDSFLGRKYVSHSSSKAGMLQKRWLARSGRKGGRQGPG